MDQSAPARSGGATTIASATAIAAGVYQAAKRSMNRAVGAFEACACSTRRMIRAIVLSAAVRVMRTRSTPFALMLAAYTVSPMPLATGTDSPVTGASSTSERPSITSPSEGTRSPGRTTAVSSTRSASIGTSAIAPSRSTRAVRGMRPIRLSIPARARAAAIRSSSSPTANRKMTTAASSADPIAIAPTVAIDISVSMVKGVPPRKAAAARRTTGTRPTSAASAKLHWPRAGTATETAPADARSSAVARTVVALGVFHQSDVGLCTRGAMTAPGSPASRGIGL